MLAAAAFRFHDVIFLSLIFFAFFAYATLIFAMP